MNVYMFLIFFHLILLSIQLAQSVRRGNTRKRSNPCETAEAILSLIAIEHGFHQILELEGFAPLLKFLGVKVWVRNKRIEQVFFNVI